MRQSDLKKYYVSRDLHFVLTLLCCIKVVYPCFRNYSANKNMFYISLLQLIQHKYYIFASLTSHYNRFLLMWRHRCQQKPKVIYTSVFDNLNANGTMANRISLFSYLLNHALNGTEMYGVVRHCNCHNPSIHHLYLGVRFNQRTTKGPLWKNACWSLFQFMEVVYFVFVYELLKENFLTEMSSLAIFLFII